MAPDNWGRVDEWTSNAPITTRGASGFVDFGWLGRLDVRGPIESFGVGARGFNLYDGELASASFDSIVTRADGGVGIQVARPRPMLTVRGDVRTEGGRGVSLVRGERVELEAIALSVKAGGSIGEATVGGRLETRGDGVVTIEPGGTIGRLDVAGGVVATGRESDAARVSPATGAALAGVVVRSEQGRDFALTETSSLARPQNHAYRVVDIALHAWRWRGPSAGTRDEPRTPRESRSTVGG
jgi:hypothetical protein